MLSLFPALIAVVSIYGLVLDPVDVERQVAELAVEVDGCQVTLYAAADVDEARATEVAEPLDLGARLKAARGARALSLRALGEKTGFSAAFLSQVELGQASPSLASLGKIAAGLGLTLAELVSEPSARAGPQVCRRDDQTLKSEWSRATVRSLVPSGTSTSLGAVVINLEPGGKSGRSNAAESGEIFAFCVRGKVELTLSDDESFKLGSGDSILFDASRAATWRNPSKADTEILLVTHRGRGA